MGRLKIVAMVGAIGLIAAGCSSDSSTTSPSPSPTQVAQKPAATQKFNQPIVTPKQPPALGTIPGLIQSTNADERARQVQNTINGTKTKKDPFNSVPVSITRTVPATPPQTLPRSPQSSQPPIATPRSTPLPPRPSSPFPNIASRPGPPSNSSSTNPSSANPSSTNPSATPNPNQIATLPPLPSANTANAVQVSGVVQVGREVQAIVRAPNEETSRYVRVGQRLSNGQVLVKRIVVNTGGTPVVILEENGVEVAKAVGEGVPSTPGQPAQPGRAA